ncbi:MAG TPA: SDR family oxidoreductase [Pseudonocardiaceae bacterium]|nr:SDR family oxidoreductase [Pseudonocardiaceae bacterium]
MDSSAHGADIARTEGVGTTPTFLITGATGPVAGPTIALLAGRGDRLLLTGRNRERLAELEQRYGARGQVETFAVDVTDSVGAGIAADTVIERFGRLDGLIHMVGDFQAGPVVKTDPADYQRAMSVNFISAVVATKAVLPLLGNGGRLVYFGTPVAQEPLPGMSCYAASKAALTAWVRSLSHEVKHRGVHANMVVMTMADTPDARAARPHLDFDEAVSPALVARAVGFLASEAADGLYGSLVPVLGRFGFATALAPRGPAPAP